MLLSEVQSTIEDLFEHNRRKNFILQRVRTPESERDVVTCLVQIKDFMYQENVPIDLSNKILKWVAFDFSQQVVRDKKAEALENIPVIFQCSE